MPLLDRAGNRRTVAAVLTMLPHVCFRILDEWQMGFPLVDLKHVLSAEADADQHREALSVVFSKLHRDQFSKFIQSTFEAALGERLSDARDRLVASLCQKNIDTLSFNPYHSPRHIACTVLSAAILCISEGFSSEEIFWLLVAALGHDIAHNGQVYEAPPLLERRSALITAREMKSLGFSKDVRLRVSRMILATFPRYRECIRRLCDAAELRFLNLVAGSQEVTPVLKAIVRDPVLVRQCAILSDADLFMSLAISDDMSELQSKLVLLETHADERGEFENLKVAFYRDVSGDNVASRGAVVFGDQLARMWRKELGINLDLKSISFSKRAKHKRASLRKCLANELHTLRGCSRKISIGDRNGHLIAQGGGQFIALTRAGIIAAGRIAGGRREFERVIS